jgi:hypothetical protein
MHRPMLLRRAIRRRPNALEQAGGAPGIFGCKCAASTAESVNARSGVQGVVLLNFDCSEMLAGLEVRGTELSG